MVNKTHISSRYVIVDKETAEIIAECINVDELMSTLAELYAKHKTLVNYQIKPEIKAE